MKKIYLIMLFYYAFFCNLAYATIQFGLTGFKYNCIARTITVTGFLFGDGISGPISFGTGWIFNQTRVYNQDVIINTPVFDGVLFTINVPNDITGWPNVFIIVTSQEGTLIQTSGYTSILLACPLSVVNNYSLLLRSRLHTKLNKLLANDIQNAMPQLRGITNGSAVDVEIKTLNGTSLGTFNAIVEPNNEWHRVIPKLNPGNYRVIVTSKRTGTGGKETSTIRSQISITTTNFITIEEPSETIIRNTKPLFQGKTKPNSSLGIFFDGNLVSEIIADANGNWSFKFINAINQGDHELKAISVDTLSNRAEIIFPFTVVTST